MTEHDPEFHRRIIEQSRGQSVWQSGQPTQTWDTPAEDASPKNKNQWTLFAIIGGVGVVVMLVLLMSASGVGTGGGSAPSGTVAAPLTAESAAETVGRMYLAFFSGDAAAFESCMASSARPVPAELSSELDEFRQQYEEVGWTSTVGWSDGAYTVELREPSGNEDVTIAVTPVTSDGVSAEVSVAVGDDTYSEDEGTFGLVAEDGTWLISEIDGRPIWEEY